MSIPIEVTACRAFLVKQVSLAQTDEAREEASKALTGFTILSGGMARMFALISYIPEEHLEKASAAVELIEKSMAPNASPLTH